MQFLQLMLIFLLTASPKVVFEETEYNFGRAYEQDSIVHFFKFYNKGDDTLRITNVKSSCGCTAALTTNSIIPPGDSGSIKTVFKTGRYRGKVSKVVHVYTNDPKKNVVTLTITGEVVKVLDLEPARINFGQLNQGEEAEEVVKVYPALEGIEIAIDSVRGRDLITSFEKIEENGRKGYRLKVALSTNKKFPSGFHYIPLLIYLSKPKKLRIEVPVTFRIRSKIEVFPKILTFGTVPKDTIITTQVYFKNNSGNPIHIVDVITNDSEIKVDVKAEKEGFDYVINVTLEPSPFKSFIKSSIVIKTDDSEKPEIEVPVYAIIK